MLIPVVGQTRVYKWWGNARHTVLETGLHELLNDITLLGVSDTTDALKPVWIMDRRTHVSHPPYEKTGTRYVGSDKAFTKPKMADLRDQMVRGFCTTGCQL